MSSVGPHGHHINPRKSSDHPDAPSHPSHIDVPDRPVVLATLPRTHRGAGQPHNPVIPSHPHHRLTPREPPSLRVPVANAPPPLGPQLTPNLFPTALPTNPVDFYNVIQATAGSLPPQPSSNVALPLPELDFLSPYSATCWQIRDLNQLVDYYNQVVQLYASVNSDVLKKAQRLASGTSLQNSATSSSATLARRRLPPPCVPGQPQALVNFNVFRSSSVFRFGQGSMFAVENWQRLQPSGTTNAPWASSSSLADQPSPPGRFEIVDDQDTEPESPPLPDSPVEEQVKDSLQQGQDGIIGQLDAFQVRSAEKQACSMRNHVSRSPPTGEMAAAQARCMVCGRYYWIKEL